MISFDRTFTCMILFLVINFKNGDFIDIEDEKVIMENNKHNIFCGLAKFLYPVFRISASDINYLLFTPNNPKLPCDLQPNPEALNMCDFDPNLETKVIIHGWISKIPIPEALTCTIKDQYLEEDDYNVVVVNWTSYNQDRSKIGYAFSTLNSVYIGLRLSSWMRFLQLEAGANPEKFHLLGHSLGGEVASYAGKSICRVGRITHIDAAEPGFSKLPAVMRPNPNDALIVDAIHTSGSDSYKTGSGIEFPIGDIDYYPNGGTHQSKCSFGLKFQIITGEMKKEIYKETLKHVIDQIEKDSKDTCELQDDIYWLFLETNPYSLNVNYLLFTRTNPHEPCDLQPSRDSLKRCHFDPSLPTKVLIHGWIDEVPPEDMKFFMKDKLLEEGRYNVVVYNWTYYDQNQDLYVAGYSQSSVSSVLIGLKLASWIRFLQVHTGARPELFHILAHSLGGPVASFAGKTICGLGKITYFDAAGPIFKFLPTSLRPSYNDALFVEAIHTNGADFVLNGIGLKKPFADIDYFPNGGSKQPKCYYGAKFFYVTGETATVDGPANEISCNHDAPYDYYLSSFNKECRFIGLLCESYEDFNSGKCNKSNSVPCQMGYYSEVIPGKPPYLKCFLNTSSEYPYCIS